MKSHAGYEPESKLMWCMECERSVPRATFSHVHDVILSRALVKMKVEKVRVWNTDTSFFDAFSVDLDDFRVHSYFWTRPDPDGVRHYMAEMEANPRFYGGQMIAFKAWTSDILVGSRVRPSIQQEK